MNPAATGFQVLIPERGRPDLLAGTLAALAQARMGLGAAHDVQVLVNGAPAQDYAPLVQQHQDVRFSFEPRALGFHGAIARLLAQARAPWVYLLNSDMRLHPDALRAILPWRDTDVFAIASQIEFADRSRRREETGYTVPVRGPDGQLELHDRLPIDGSVRGHLYAGGGASLFQTCALRRYLALSHAYAPFYFEDADWSMQAWAEGLRVLFCPDSRAVHEHRGTIGRYVPARTIERIVRRNLGHFRWRYGDLFDAPRWGEGAVERLAAIGRALRSEHRNTRRRVLAGRGAALWSQLHQQRYPHAQRWRDGRPRVLLVSPFALLSPDHWRVSAGLNLARASAQRIDWLLLHDGAEGEPQAAADDACFREIQPIAGCAAGADLEARCAAHARPQLLAALQQLIATRRPDLVCFEHVECLGLIEQLRRDVPIIWSLPDSGGNLTPPLQQRVRAALPKVAALVLGPAHALGHWRHRNERVMDSGDGGTGMPAGSVQQWLELITALGAYSRIEPVGADSSRESSRGVNPRPH
ncbi:MAG TPA: glycosyltransferase [Xanthomonadales bacterium]|nr:glycosyltransferase [Xanthomonadales bacterium]